MNTNTIHADGITHSLATACSDTLKRLAERATPAAIVGAVAHTSRGKRQKERCTAP